MKLILFSSTMLSLCVRGNFGRTDQIVKISEPVVGKRFHGCHPPSSGVIFLCSHEGLENYFCVKMPGPGCK